MRVLTSSSVSARGIQGEVTTCVVRSKPSSRARSSSPSPVSGNGQTKVNRAYGVRKSAVSRGQKGAPKVTAVAAPERPLEQETLERVGRVQVLFRDGVTEDLLFEEGGGGRRPSERTMTVRSPFYDLDSTEGFFVSQDTMPHPSLHTSLWSSLEFSDLLVEEKEERQRTKANSHRQLVTVDKMGDHEVWSVKTPLGTQEVGGASDDQFNQQQQLAAISTRSEAARGTKSSRSKLKQKTSTHATDNVVRVNGKEARKITRQRSQSWVRAGKKAKAGLEGERRLGLGNLAAKGSRAERNSHRTTGKVWERAITTIPSSTCKPFVS
eukprot:1183319-Prorocentrum_minimum.AAC.4